MLQDKYNQLVKNTEDFVKAKTEEVSALELKKDILRGTTSIVPFVGATVLFTAAAKGSVPLIFVGCALFYLNMPLNGWYHNVFWAHDGAERSLKKAKETHEKISESGCETENDLKALRESFKLTKQY